MRNIIRILKISTEGGIDISQGRKCLRAPGQPGKAGNSAIESILLIFIDTKET